MLNDEVDTFGSGEKSSPARITPLARRIAGDMGYNMGTISGSGYQGKIYSHDLKHAVSAEEQALSFAERFMAFASNHTQEPAPERVPEPAPVLDLPKAAPQHSPVTYENVPKFQAFEAVQPPAPAYRTVAEAVQTPAPAYPAAAEAAQTPAPAYRAATEAVQTPAPVYQAAAEAVQTPAPVYQAAAEADQTPAPVYRAVDEAVQTPVPVYRAAFEADQTSAPVYRAVPEADQTPAPVYRAVPEAAKTPAPVYSAVPEAVQTPAPAYQAAAEAVQTPVPVYRAVAEAAKTPAPVYRAAFEAAQTPAPVSGDVAETVQTPMPAPGIVPAHSMAVTQHVETDVTALERLRRSMNADNDKRGQEQIPLEAFYIKALAICMREKERFRMRPTGSKDNYQLIDGAPIGIQTGTDRDAAIPVVHDADKKPLGEIASEVAGLVEKARRGNLSAKETEGAAITVIDKSKSGIYAFVPIIRQSESAVLGIGAMYQKLVMTDMSIENKWFITQTLTFDHHVINGTDADEFQRRLKEILEDPQLLVR